MFKDQYRAVMQYSLPRDAGKPGDNGSPRLIHHDWICAKVILNDILIDPRRLIFNFDSLFEFIVMY